MSKITIHHKWWLYSMKYKNLPIHNLETTEIDTLVDTGMIEYNQEKEDYVLTRQGHKLVEENIAIIYPLVPKNTNKGYMDTINTMRSPAITTLINVMTNMVDVVVSKVNIKILLRFVKAILYRVIPKLDNSGLKELKDLINSFSEVTEKTDSNGIFKDEEIKTEIQLLNRNITIIAIKNDTVVYRNNVGNEEISTFSKLGITLNDILKAVTNNPVSVKEDE